MEKIYEHTNCVMQLDEAKSLVFMEMRGFFNYDTYVKVSQDRLNILRSHKVRNLITDARKMKVLNQESMKYNDEIYVPSLEKIGIKKSFLVVADNIFTNSMLERIDTRLKESHSKIEVRFFKDVDTAINEL